MQTFTVENDANGALVVDTTLVTVPAQETNGAVTFGFEEHNGDCVRDYSGTITPTGGSTADVALDVKTQCTGVNCEDKWAGTATKVEG